MSIDIEIPKTYEKLIFADYKQGDSRIIIFGEPKLWRLLNSATHFFCDGTFKLCQKNFYQLYTIHADIGSNDDFVNVVPVLYALLPNKRQGTYETLFSLIRSQVPDWNPLKISMDFESSAILAIRNVLPGTKIVGCHFHFLRCLWKKSKQFGLNRTTLGKVYTKLCAALAHLPPHLIDEGWLCVMSESFNRPDYTAFNDYFVKTWLENRIFANIWCIYGEKHRTNNIVESWNSHFRRFSDQRPNIIYFLIGVQKDINFILRKVNNNIAMIFKKKQATKDVDQRVMMAKQELLSDNISVGHFLQKLRN